ncbi:hypothetical protein TeGR_g4896, partial [Tetraparma gracilis]
MPASGPAFGALPSPFRRLELYLMHNNVDFVFIAQAVFTHLVRYGTLLLGPLLIAVACSIVAGLFYIDCTLVLPLLHETRFTPSYVAHVLASSFLAVNVLFNYYCCVTARHDGPEYDRVVRELAARTKYAFPETEEEREERKREFEGRILERNRANRRRAEQRLQREREVSLLEQGSAGEEEEEEDEPGPVEVPEGGGGEEPKPVRSWQV